MRILRSYFIYSSLLIFLLGWCSSFQAPLNSGNAQLRWEWAQQHQAIDSLLFYHAQLQAQWKAEDNLAIAEAQNRQFLNYILNNKELGGEEKRILLEQYSSSRDWNYAYRVQWHSQYGERDSAYFYQSLLERSPKKEAALLYAYGQLAINFGLRQRNYRAANSYLNQAERSTKTTHDSLLLYPIQVQVYGALGQVKRAIQAGLALVRLQRQEATIDSTALATTFDDLGQLYQEQGDYYQATIYIRAAINHLANRSGHAVWIGELWYQLARAYYHIENKPLETILYARNALSKWKEMPSTKSSYIDVYQLLSQQFLKAEQLDSSQVYLDRTIQLQKKYSYKIAEGYTIQAEIYQRLGKMEAATVALKKGLTATLDKQGNKGLAVATHWLALGRHYQQEKQWSSARQALTEAFWALSWQPKSRGLPSKKSLFSRRMALTIGNAQVKTLLALQEQSKYAISNELLQQQLDYNIALLQQLQVLQPWDLELWKEAKQARQQMIEWQWRCFSKTANPVLLERAFVQAEANRQAVIAKELQRHWKKNSTGALVALQEQLRQQQARREWCQEHIWKAYQQGDSSQLDWCRQQLAASKVNWTLAHQQLQRQYQQHYEWYYKPTPVILDSLQTRLKTGDALLEYFECEKVLYQFVVTKDTLVLRRIVWDKYQPTILKYGKHFTNPKMRQYLESGSFQDFCRTGHSLYYRLVHHELLKQIQRLIIIPDGLLQQLPFEVLLTEIPLDSIHKADFSKLNYLLRNKKIHYHYSSELWWRSWQRNKPLVANELLAMGATYMDNKKASRTTAQQQLRQQISLQPYMEGLLDSLSAYYAGDFYDSRYASEYYYKNYIAGYGLLYLGFYGYNGAVSHSLPSLILAEDGYEKEDNFLSIYEIQNQPTQAELVFLGNIYESQSEDLLALGSSFLYAGSKGVILPLWQQDSTAVEVVRYYYNALQQGLENDEALRQAKLHYLKVVGGIAGHPSHWAGYILIGNQQTIKVAAPVTYIWWFVIPIAFISFLGWWSLQALRQKR